MKSFGKVSLALNLVLILLMIFIFVKKRSSDDQPSTRELVAKGAVKSIMERKSVREFTDKSIGRDTFNLLIKAAMAAPTAGNRQPWSFIVVTRKDLLKKLADGLPYAQMLNEANAAVVVCGNPAESLEGLESDFWVQDCAAASENFLIAAESLGLGACWTGVFPLKERISLVVKTLDIRDGYIPLNVIAVGHPNGPQQAKDKYKPEKVHWEKW